MEEMGMAQQELQLAAAVREIRACNAISEEYGLRLRETEILELAQSRMQALQAAGRMEFGGGILPKLIEAFCDSPFVHAANFSETLAQLQEAFYYFKTEADERFSDDELLAFMAETFNGRAQGSTEYLTGTSLEELCRYAREGWQMWDAQCAGDLF